MRRETETGMLRVLGGTRNWEDARKDGAFRGSVDLPALRFQSSDLQKVIPLVLSPLVIICYGNPMELI